MIITWVYEFNWIISVLMAIEMHGNLYNNVNVGHVNGTDVEILEKSVFGGKCYTIKHFMCEKASSNYFKFI